MDTKPETLNAAQAALLSLIAKAGTDGCIVYGRPYAATAAALENRGLVARSCGRVSVASMGILEDRPLYCATDAGKILATRLSGV